jgi:hypothetical protein
LKSIKSNTFLTKKSDHIKINNKNKPVKSKDKKKLPETKFIFPKKESTIKNAVNKIELSKTIKCFTNSLYT